MNTESDLELWGNAWRAPTAATVAPAFDFRAEHRRQQWRLRAGYLFGLGFAVFLTAYAAAVLHRDFRPEVIAWAIVIWITTAGVTAFFVWNWRGLWNASGRSVTEYANLYEKQSLARLRAIRFGYRFLALQLSISVPWLSWDFTRHEITGARYALSMAFLGVFTVAYIVWFTISKRRALLELKRVEEFRHSACEGDLVQKA